MRDTFVWLIFTGMRPPRTNAIIRRISRACNRVDVS